MSQIAWCTGAGKGIGRATSRLLAERGWTVVASARTRSDLDSLASETASLSGNVVPYPLDVTDPEAVAAAAAEIEESVGKIDRALFIAGNHVPIAAKDFAVDPFRMLVEVNLMGVVHGLAAVLPRFIERRHGHVAVVASVSGYCGLPGAAAYGATKAALINMCEALKPELDQFAVRLTLINPGFVKTPLTDQNDFKMPFLMEVDDAARRIVDGLDARGFEVTFPRRFTYALKLLRMLPYPLQFAATRRLVRS
ncbi:MAG: SDR family NAD(P)-dependent oxidoreductase [Rhodospirillales bacterium]|nr:SDR family NAD(P)-dependent oxidoreductase [Rhodospirillales bacterium]